MAQWKDCKKEPSEIGKKVLCQKDGDVYVAMRLEQYYIPIPFADHYFSKDLCDAETWCEIDYPGKLTGHLRIGINGEIIKISELREKYPDTYYEFFLMYKESIGTIPMPEGMKKGRRHKCPV